MITLMWLAVAVLGALVQGVANGLITGGTWSLERVADWHLTEVVTTPVHVYITAHAAGPAHGGGGDLVGLGTDRPDPVAALLAHGFLLERPPGLGPVRRRHRRDALQRRPSH
ncbi:hypothetical protein ACQEVF_43230 [Nonomuraea polychroma]|uniref:hypothetical protein n=1 Tax=Nonomuraea polychroma TaxID=46176 RepID=UPI003D93B0F6